jgi:hypothetical protein
MYTTWSAFLPSDDASDARKSPPLQKAYLCSARHAVCITPRHTSLGHSVTQLMVPGGPRPMTVRGQTKARHGGYPTTHPTIKKIPHHKAYPCSARRAIRITPRHTSLGHCVTQLMVLGGPRPTTARGRSKGRHAVGTTTHPTVKKFPPPKGTDARLVARFRSSRVTNCSTIV